jgi:hypothetical protein
MKCVKANFVARHVLSGGTRATHGIRDVRHTMHMGIGYWIVAGRLAARPLAGGGAAAM